MSFNSECDKKANYICNVRARVRIGRLCKMEDVNLPQWPYFGTAGFRSLRSRQLVSRLSHYDTDMVMALRSPVTTDWTVGGCRLDWDEMLQDVIYYWHRHTIRNPAILDPGRQVPGINISTVVHANHTVDESQSNLADVNGNVGAK